MKRQALFPSGSAKPASDICISPGIISGNHVFLTGMTGSRPDGTVPASPKDQFHQAFEKIKAVLKEAGLGLESLVEMTTYHVGLHEHFDQFNDIRAEYVVEPYPAWTAVEVAGLRRNGALVEIKVVAAMDATNT